MLIRAGATASDACRCALTTQRLALISRALVDDDLHMRR